MQTQSLHKLCGIFSMPGELQLHLQDPGSPLYYEASCGASKPLMYL